MKTEPTPSDREVLTGLVERVTYQNAENGFCVIRVKARGRRNAQGPSWFHRRPKGSTCPDCREPASAVGDR